VTRLTFCLLGLTAALALSGCLKDSGFHCSTDGDCGSGGHCEATLHCSIDDTTCAGSGRRYADGAGSLSGTCVAETADAGVPDPDGMSGETDARVGAPGAECFEGIEREPTGCAAAVCVIEPSCCEIGWSNLCVSLAETTDGCDVRCSNTVVMSGEGYAVAVATAEIGTDHPAILWSDEPQPEQPDVDRDYRTTAVAWADFDNDGDPDLATGGQQQLRIYRNEGWDGGKPVLELLAHSPGYFDVNSITWLDVDDDGWLDAVFGGGEGLRIARNFHPDTTQDFLFDPVTNQGEGISRIAWGDVDQDGDLDLAMCRTSAAGLYRNEGGTLTPDVDFSGPTQAKGVSWCDLDGDHFPELVIGSFGGVFVYHNEGGTLVEPTVATPRDVWVQNLICGDLDNDGDQDVVVTIFQGHTLVLRNDGGSLVQSEMSMSADSHRGLDLADLDGDRDLDIITVGGGSSLSYTIMRNRLEAGELAFIDEIGTIGLDPQIAAYACDVTALPPPP
jgi:VCBS repeat protein